MFSLYAFARITDDMADGDASLMSKRKALSAWLALTESLESLSGSKRSIAMHSAASPLWSSLRHATQSYGIPKKLLTDIVRGVIMDLDHAQPHDWPELEHYCHHVASAVGLACTHIWQADRAMPEKVAIDCGMAFQLTNILRDIANDARMGRIYIPANELALFDVDASRWLSGVPNGDWRSVIRSVAQRAEALYASGWNTIKYLPPPGRRLFSLMWRYYHALLHEVVRNVDRLWKTPRTRIPTSVRARLAAQHFIAPLYWSLPSPVA
jgi:phytoene synthase